MGLSIFSRALATAANIIGKVRLVDSGGTEVTEATGHSVQVKLIAGTALAGKIGHDTTSLGHGVMTVTTGGSDLVLAASTACKWVCIQAQTDNTNPVAVGASGVDAAIATGTGVILYAGETITLLVDNLADVYVDSITSGEGVRYTYGI